MKDIYMLNKHLSIANKLSFANSNKTRKGYEIALIINNLAI